MTEPFDRHLYDAVMADLESTERTTEEYRRGYHTGVEHAARLAAERASRCVHGDGTGLCPVCDGIELAAPVAVSDEEWLVMTFWGAANTAKPDEAHDDWAIRAGIRAVRAALAGPVQVPEADTPD